MPSATNFAIGREKLDRELIFMKVSVKKQLKKANAAYSINWSLITDLFLSENDQNLLSEKLIIKPVMYAMETLVNNEKPNFNKTKKRA